MYTVLNSDFQVKGSLTLNNGRGSTAFFADTITQQIATDDSNNPDTLLSNSFNDYDKQGNTKQWNHTLTLSVEATTLGTSITTSDYIMYFDEVAKKYYMMKVIDTATDRNSGFITVDCINTAIYELGKQLVVEEKTFQNATLSQVVESVYKNAPFSVVIQDDLTISIDYTISANTSLQSIVQDLQTKYNVDVDSWITLDNDGQIGERVLYFGHLGSDNGELIRYGGGKGFENINAQELSDIIYTKVYVTGVTSDTDTTKGHIGSVNNGLEYIVDDDANQRMYAVGASQQQPVYLEGQLTNNILSEPSALLDWGKEQLALFNHPRFNYTVTPLHDEVVGIGDSITVQDFHIQPMILVTSKVIQKSTSFASPETNTFVLGEFSSIFSDRTSKNNMVIEVIKKDVTVVQEAADYAKAQADEAHRQAVLAQEQAIHAQTSADGKTTTYTVDDFQDLPGNAVEGDLGWVKTSDGTVMYIYTKKADGTFAWVENVNPHTKEDIANAVDTSVKTAKEYTDDAIKTNNTDINNTINEVSQEKIDATLADANFNAKAQAMADKALADAKANTATVAQDTLDSANENIAQAKSDITDAYKNADGVISKKVDDTATSIGNTINQNKIDSDGKISTAQSTATQALNEVTTKVSQTDYNAKTGDLDTRVTKAQTTADSAVTTVGNYKTSNDARVKATETSIAQNAKDITLRATTADLNSAKSDYNAQIAQVKVDAGKVETTVSNLSDTVNNLSIGGRNYFLNSSGSSLEGWGQTDGWNIITGTYRGSVFSIKPTSTWTGGNHNSLYKTGLTIPSGTEVTVSFWAKADIAGAKFHSEPNGSYASYNPVLTTDWSRYSYTFTLTSTTIYFMGVDAGKTYYLDDIKLEIGNMATDWTPAPEDTVNALASQQVTIDGITDTVSKQSTNIDSVTQRVTTAEGTLTTATNNISGLQTKQTTTANQVTQEIADRKTGDNNTLQSSKDFTTSNITSAVNGVNSTITQTASGILAQVEATNMVVNSEFDPLNGTWYQLVGSGAVNSTVGTAWSPSATLSFSDWAVVDGSTLLTYAVGTWFTTALAPAGAGRAYSASIIAGRPSAVTTSTALDLRIGFWDANKKLLSNASSGNIIDGTAYKGIDKYKVENKVAPANTKYVSVIIAHSSASATDIIGRPMLNNGTTVSPYVATFGNTSSSTILSLFKDNWSIGIANNIGAITSGIVGDTNSISLINKHIILDSENTTVTGDFYALGGNFKNLNASNMTVGTLNGNQVNITNVNVSNLVGDTITGFNFNINKSMFIAPGGTITSGVMSMTNDGFSIVAQAGGFSVTANNISASRQSPQGYKVTGYGTYHINSELGLSGGDGTIQVFNPGDTSGTPYKTGAFHSEYGLNNLLIKTSNYSNGDLDEYLNISSASFDLYNMDKNNNITRSVNFSHGSGTFSDSMTVPTINATTMYNDTNLWLKSNKNSVVLQGGGINILQARENGYLYYMTMKRGSGGASVQASTSDGAFFIQTSATNYKEDIQYDGGTSVGDRFLTLDPATWQDKGEYEQRKLYRENGTSPDRTINMDDKRYYGLIAEDLVKAGLEEFVVRDEVTGEVNGLEYDKVAISLIPVVREQRNALNELRVEIERLKDKING